MKGRFTSGLLIVLGLMCFAHCSQNSWGQMFKRKSVNLKRENSFTTLNSFSEFASLRKLGDLNKVCQDSMFEDIISKWNYPIEVHHAVTKDKYILKLFRIQAKNTAISPNKPVIFLQHGIFDSADNWVINGQGNSLGLLLADAGYDVWLGNNRGNKYSKVTTDPKMSRREFWDFSFQEMALYDVPANIAYILAQTKVEKITYIGHSQGTTQMFAALTDPETKDYVNSKVNKFIALAPVVYLSNQGSLILKTIAVAEPIIKPIAETFGIYDFFPGACTETSIQSRFQAAVCKLFPPLCNFILSVADPNPKYDNTADMPYFAKHIPSGDSLKTLYHYRQFVTMDKFKPVFQKYDYGKSKNKKIYGTSTPPEYDFRNIKIPVRMHVGTDDHIGDVKDNAILRLNLDQKGVDVKYYNYNQCGHMTFMWAKNMSPIYRDVLSELKEVTQ